MTTMQFVTAKPIQVRLQPAVSAALGVPDADIPLWGATLSGGWLIAMYKETNGDITRYVLPPESVLYVRQRQTDLDTGAGASAPARLP